MDGIYWHIVLLLYCHESEGLLPALRNVCTLTFCYVLKKWNFLLASILRSCSSKFCHLLSSWSWQTARMSCVLYLTSLINLANRVFFRFEIYRNLSKIFMQLKLLLQFVFLIEFAYMQSSLLPHTASESHSFFFWIPVWTKPLIKYVSRRWLHWLRSTYGLQKHDVLSAMGASHALCLISGLGYWS